MSDVTNKINYLKKLYREIVLGFSAFDYAGQPIFIKHFSELDNGDLESERLNSFNIGKERGLQDREEKMSLLIKEGYWSRDKEDEISKIKKEISDYEMLLKNLVIKRQIISTKDKIRNLNRKLEEIHQEKSEVFGLCLEDFVEKKMNELTIYNSFYKNKTLNERLFSEEEFDRLPEIEISKLVGLLNNFYINFSHSEIKKICACHFFISIFGLCEDDAFNFFGKRICDLSILQINLFSQGRYFKSLMQSRNDQGMPPSDVMDDPDKMIEWYDQMSHGPKAESDGVSYFGASKSELQEMAGGKAIDMQDFAKKKNNSMSTKDFIEMHGI